MHLIHVERCRLGQPNHKFMAYLLLFELADKACQFRRFLKTPDNCSSKDKWPNLIHDLRLDVHDCFLYESPRVTFNFRRELDLKLVKCSVFVGEVQFVVVRNDVFLVLGECLAGCWPLWQLYFLLRFHLTNYKHSYDAAFQV